MEQNILTMTPEKLDAHWVTVGRQKQIEVPNNSNALEGVVASYTCDGQFGPHAVMRAVMCIVGWKGMQDNYESNAANAFCDYIGSSHVVALKGNTWIVEVHDCGWQIFLVRMCADGRFDVRWVETLERFCKLNNKKALTVTRQNLKQFHITPLGVSDNEWSDVAPDLATVCLIVFGTQFLHRIDREITCKWQSYRSRATVWTDAVVRKDVFLRVHLQPYGETMEGKDVSRYEIYREDGSWFVGREGAQKAEEERRSKAMMALLD